MRALLLAGFALVLTSAALRTEAGEPEAAPCSPSLVVADPAGERLYIADATRALVHRLDLATGKPMDPAVVGISATGLAVAPDSGTLYVTSAAQGGAIWSCRIREPMSSVIQVRAPTPTSPVISPDGTTLWVCHRFADEVAAYDAATLEVRARVSLPREPIASALTPDGRRLVVGQHLPEGAADGDYAATAVHVIDTEKAEVVASVGLPNGSTSLMGVCVSPDGRHAFATHILGRYFVPTTQIERGWINTNALSIVDLESLESVATILLDDVGHGAANPWGVACTPDGSELLVAHAGTHELSRIDWPALRQALGDLDDEATEALTYDLTFLAPYRKRVPLGGVGPRGLTVAAGRVWVAEYFSGSLGSVPLSGGERAQATTIPLTDEPVPISLERRGEMLFFDARICLQQWQSCASCHPDARADALNWDLLNDGFGNPKNTRSMLLAHRTPPAMSIGIRADGKTAVRAGIRHILFAVRPEEDALAIDAYLQSLTPLRSPASLRPENQARIARGALVFEKAQCHVCHSGSLRTDLKQYDLGTGRGGDVDKLFDTPTLVEIWRTAPYLHDGRAPDLRSVLEEHNPGDRHGHTSELCDRDLDDLVAFLFSL